MNSPGFESVKTVEVNGTTLAYREDGEGEPVVFVHGAISDLRTWEQQLPAVGRTYRAIAYSRRFARPNEDIHPGMDDPWLRQVEDLIAFLKEIDAVPAHLVGNSYGAYISLLAAIRQPEIARSLVLEEPPVVPLFVSWPPRPAELLRRIATRPRAALTVLGYVAGNLVRVQSAFRRGENDEAMELFCRGVLGEAHIKRLSGTRKAQIRDNLSTLRAACVHDGGFPPLGDDEVRGVRAPTLLVTGQHSPAVLIRLADRLEELLPNVERAEIPSASHLMHEDNAPALNEAVVAFLGRQRGKPHPRIVS